MTWLTHPTERTARGLVRVRGHERRLLAALGVALLVFVAACWVGIAVLGALPGDAASAAEVREHHLGGVILAPARALAWLGQPPAAIVVVLALAGWTWRRIGWRHALLVAAASGVSAVAWLLKEAVDRPRPAGAAVSGMSFPSGHTTVTVAVVGLLAVFAAQRRWWWVAAGCAAVIAAMGPSRVLLGVHWASDVLAGYAVGLAWLIGVLLAGARWARRDGPLGDGAAPAEGG